MSANKWLLKQLGAIVSEFNDKTTSLTKAQERSFDLCFKLLHFDAKIEADLPKQTRSVRQRTRRFLKDVAHSLPSEVFLLCTLVSNTGLGQHMLHIDLPVIERWWKSKKRPKGVTTVKDAKAKAVTANAVNISIDSRSSESSGSESFSSTQNPAINLNISATQEGRTVGNASLPGIAKIFDKRLCDAIRKNLLEDKWKAAVTMVFPEWNLDSMVRCVMSLDICKQDIEWLALSLFGAKVKPIEQGLHIIFHDGITLVIPNFEATLKGVLDDVVCAVFGLDIYNAIMDCPIRKRELADGKLATECVSMIFTKDGGIISLSLGLRAAWRMRNWLYTT